MNEKNDNTERTAAREKMITMRNTKMKTAAALALLFLLPSYLPAKEHPGKGQQYTLPGRNERVRHDEGQGTVGWNNRQQDRYESFRNDYRKQSRIEQHALERLRRERARELDRRHPDRRAIAHLDGDIRAGEYRLERIRRAYLDRCRSLCTPRQRDRFEAMIRINSPEAVLMLRF